MGVNRKDMTLNGRSQNTEDKYCRVREKKQKTPGSEELRDGSEKEERGLVWDDANVQNMAASWSLNSANVLTLLKLYILKWEHECCIYFTTRRKIAQKKKNHRIKSGQEDEELFLRISETCHSTKEPNSWQMPGLLRWRLYSPERREGFEEKRHSRKDFLVRKAWNMF